MTDLVPIRLKRFCLSCAVTALLLSPATAPAELRGPYTNDVNTLYLFHFNEAAGGSVTTNAGSKGGSCYTVTNAITGNGVTVPPPVTTLLGYASYSGFGNAVSGTNTDGLADGLVGFDGNNSGAYDADVQGGPASPDAIAHTNLNIGNGGVTPFTLEALICPTVINANQEIICTDNYTGSRGFQFKITSAGQLQFQFISPVGLNLTIAIPSSGTHAFVANTWYHVAATYDGTAVKLYWTKLDPSITAANQIATAPWTVGANYGAVVAPFVIAAENRGSAQESFRGLIDEVRISSVARGPGEMQFFSPTVTISQDPASQNIDYGQPVTFSVNASSLTALGYQWRHGGTPIPGGAATNTSYTIASVGPADGGNYDCVVTNASGNSATSHVAILVVGAPNFLAHRYSFITDTSDSVGGAWGTNSGNATVADGALVLDGTTETFMQLPGGLLNGLSAVTVEFWITNGVNGDNCRIFDFGNTNGVLLGVAGQPAGYVFFSPHAGANHRLTLTGGGPEFEQNLTPTGTFDERAVHVACVVDPPTHNLAIYTNGVLEAVNTNLATSLASLVNLISYVGRSLYPADAYLNGSIDELRIYNGALSPSSVMLNHVLGVTNLASDGPVTIMQDPANLTCAAGQTATFSVVADGRQPIAYQWYKNGLPIPDGTNASVSFTTVLGDNNASIQVLATNNVGATVYNDSSGVATLTVIQSQTLAWVGGNGDWDTVTSNWTNGAALVPFAQFNGALFDNRGSGQPNVNLTADINVTALSVNSSSDYLLTSYAQNGSLSGQATLLKQGSGKFTIDVANNCTGPNIIQGGTLQVGNGGSFGSLNNGPITNNATLSFNRSDAIGVATAIHGTGTLAFDGSGAVALQGSNDYSGSTLINLGTVNLRNSSGLGATSVGTTVSSGQLFIDANVDVNGEALTLNASGPDGSGALRKGGAGATAYNAPITLASDATIGVDGGSTLTLTNTAGINGANVNLTIAGAGNTVIGAAVSLGVGALTKTGGGTLTLNAANNYSGGTALSGGVIAVNTNRALGTGTITCDAGGRVVFATGMTFTNAIVANVVAPGVGTGFLMVGNNTSNTVTTLSGPITLNVSAASGGHFAGPTSSGYLSVIKPLVMPDATIMSVRLGNVRFSGGGYYQEIEVRANTTSIGANNGIATNAIMDIGGNGSSTVPTLFDLNGFNQTLAGLRNLVAPANVGWVTNSGATPSTLTLNLGDGNAWSFEGGIVGNVSLALNSGVQTLATNGAPISGRFTYSGNTLINGGTLTLGLGVGLPNTPVINIASVATLDVTAGGLRLGAAQTLKGNNAFNVSGSLTNLGTIELKLNKSGASRTNDNINGLGHIQFGGTLKLNITASPALTTSDSFKLFYASTYGGAFASFDPPTPGSGLAWDANTLATDGILRIAVGTVQQPVTISTVSVSGGNVIFSGSNAPASGSYVILSSTNVAAPLGSWTHEVTNPWPGTASFSITNPIISGAPQRFYRLQSQ